MKKFFKFMDVLILVLLISLLNNDTFYATQHSLFESKTITDPHKTWTIKFNMPLNPLSVNNNFVYVTDSNGVIQNTNVLLKEDRKSISVSLVDSKYESNKDYYLTVESWVKSKNGNFLPKTVKMSFNVKADKITSNKYYSVAVGDTLYSISKKFDTTVDAIITLNNLQNTMLYAGQKLELPSDTKSNLDHNVPTDDNSKQTDGTKTDTISTDNDKNDENNKITSYKYYSVIKGDTLYGIARKFDTTVDTIINLNDIQNTVLYVGKVLKLPDDNTSNSDYNSSADDSSNPTDSSTNTDTPPNDDKIQIPITTEFKLGDDIFIDKYSYLIDGKNVGLITNQTGVNSNGKSIIDILYQYPKAKLKALYGPEHGIDGQAEAGAYVKSYNHPVLNIPVYSLYGATRMPSSDMLLNVDVLVFDIQDIGARTYTFKSTLYKCMQAAKTYNKKIIVLDRPNPIGGIIFDGPILEDKFESFVGIDNIPMTHGMTMGELSQFFNRKIGANLTVVPMEGYTRNMIFQDTGLEWIQSSPYMPDIDSVFCYAATGLGVNTSVHQSDYFKWVGSEGLNSNEFANLLNNSNLPGVKFIPETRGSHGGVRLKITDYHTFNPAKTGIYILAYSRQLKHYPVPKSGSKIEFFDKIMGTDKIGAYLEKDFSPQQIEETYKQSLEQFKMEREKYLIYPFE